jgi:DNA-binding FadR family transcriptional regulator
MSNTLTPFSPFATQRASEVIYEQIRELIISGQLKPSDRLPSERTLMEMYHRSRPTIREALRMLESSAGEDQRRQQRAVVTTPTSILSSSLFRVFCQ